MSDDVLSSGSEKVPSEWWGCDDKSSSIMGDQLGGVGCVSNLASPLF